MILLYLFVLNIFAENIETTTSSPTSSLNDGYHPPVVRKKTAIEDVRSFNSGISVSSTVYPFVKSTSDFTVQPGSQSVECLNNATYFAYQNNLCDASDPQSYISSEKAHYSCANQCGRPPPHTKGTRKECACDALCVVYKDCCQDTPVACPETYYRGTAIVTSFGYPFSFCSHRIMMVSRCNPMGSEQHEKYGSSTTELPNEFYKNSFNDIKHKSFPQPPRTLGQLTLSFGHYAVADISSGILFDELESFESCAGPNSTPYFVPVILSLRCSAMTSTANRTRASKILEWCKTVTVREIYTPFERLCLATQLITCPCDEGSYFTDHLHNACVGSSVSLAHLRYQLLNREVKTGQIDSREGQCGFNTYNSDTYLKDWVTQISISPTIVDNPIFIENTTVNSSRLNFSKINLHNNSNSNRGKNNNSSDHRLSKSSVDRLFATAVSKKWSQEKSPLTKEGLMYVLELSWTIERRLLCRSLHDYLPQCQLLDCIYGALLSHDPDRGGEFGGSRCLWPTYAVVKHHGSGGQVPLCWCMQVLAAFSELSIWNVKMRTVERHQCVIELTVRPKEEEPLEAYQLGKTARPPYPRTKWTLSLADLAERLKKLNENASVGCSLNAETRDVQVCVHFSPETDFKEVLCEKIAQDNNDYLMGQSGTYFFRMSFGVCVVSLLLASSILK
ncbi:hypothetical protein ElyMa_001625800 [Elysia marginata]|uniref:SMB domain-containing protein n=1 Tax=Elysia marginata TaxID=1093978 RepID=A0AAV4JJC9_9GAST|nr:hypothetical protein ElyMa_001625800 [Elysia marginata]